MADSLFDLDLPDDEDRVKFASVPSSRTASQAPLAVRMRPRHVDEVFGQAHLLTPGSPLRVLAGADMQVELVNDGPVTLILDSETL